jgi:2-methylisocitrate lyase-like PEP mutase family enzyme
MTIAGDTVATSQHEKGAQFRALHEEKEAFIIPNPWDAGTARLLTMLGFKALTTTSAGLAFTLGLPDGQAGLEPTLANARAIVDATHLPVAADLENGFGHAPEDAAETIRRAGLEAGLVGGSIEDASGDPSRPIYDLSHAVERVTAAAEAARALPFPFVLVARAENYLHGRLDLDDTILRLQAFESAGADALYAPGLTTAEEIRAVCASVSRPVNVLAGLRNAPFTVAELSSLGVRRISVGSALTRVALGAFLRAARTMARSGTFPFDDAMPFAELNDMMTSST